MTDRTLHTKQIAHRLNCSTKTIYRLFRDGKLTGAFKPGGRKTSPIRMRSADLQKLTKTRDWRKG